MAILYIRDELNERWIPCIEDLASIPDVARDTIYDGCALVWSSGSNMWVGGEAGGGAVDFVDQPPTSPNSKDDEFNDESLDAKWTWFNQSYLEDWDEGGTYTDSLYLQHPGWASTRIAGINQSIPVGSFTMTAKVTWGGWYGDYTRVGIFLAENNSGSPGKMVFLWMGFDMYPRIRVQRFSDPSTWAAHLADMEYNANKVYFRISYDGTTYSFFYSEDGKGWVHLYKTTSLGFTPGSIGIGIDKIFLPVGYADSSAVIDWFRVL